MTKQEFRQVKVGNILKYDPNATINIKGKYGVGTHHPEYLREKYSLLSFKVIYVNNLVGIICVLADNYMYYFHYSRFKSPNTYVTKIAKRYNI